MTGPTRRFLVALFGLCLSLAACSTPQKIEEPVGRPPSEDDNYAPRRSTQDDIYGFAPAKAPPPASTSAPTLASTPVVTQEPARPATPPPAVQGAMAMGGDMRFVGETHLASLRRLTAGGQNAEAYFSPDETRLIFQSTRGDAACDRIYTMKVDGSEVTEVTDGVGAATSAYYLPSGKEVLYASTHAQQPTCPPKPDFSKFDGYVWPLHASYDIYVKNLETGQVRPLVNHPGYDAEATISPRGDRVVFTSLRDGDLDLYSVKLDGTDLKRLTSTLGYDGGAFFSADGTKIIFRGFHYPSREEAAEYLDLLKQGVVKPSVMELFVMDADGQNMRQITHHNAASFAPFMHPDGKRVIFSSNMHDPKGRNFDLYLINLDGTGLKRITYNPTFDGFPMFSADGKKLVFASNRANSAKGETHVFMADWKE